MLIKKIKVQKGRFIYINYQNALFDLNKKELRYNQNSLSTSLHVLNKIQ